MTHKKSSDFHGGIRFQSSFTIRWELEDKNFVKIDIICLDDSLKYRIMAIKTNENFIPFSNNVTFIACVQTSPISFVARVQQRKQETSARRQDFQDASRDGLGNCF